MCDNLLISLTPTLPCHLESLLSSLTLLHFPSLHPISFHIPLPLVIASLCVTDGKTTRLKLSSPCTSEI